MYFAFDVGHNADILSPYDNVSKYVTQAFLTYQPHELPRLTLVVREPSLAPATIPMADMAQAIREDRPHRAASSQDLRQLRLAGVVELERHARQATPSIRDDGRAKVLRGETTIEEVLRVTRED